MKKIFVIFASLAAMAACTRSENILTISESESVDNGAISFEAYTATAVTKGIVATTDSVINKTGIGVFAFYQPATNGVAGPDYTTIKYPTPDFMYNQKVYCDTAKASKPWVYAPVKYWPNNTNDKLSFFAYAPYASNQSWEDLGISTDATGTKVNKTFVIYPEIADQVDYLFAEPVLNKFKPSTVTDSVKFNFAHVTSKINLYVGVDSVDQKNSTTSTGKPANWKDSCTTITIKSIEFKDLAQTLIWSKSGSSSAVYSTSGTQDIVATPGNSGKNGVIDTTWAGGWHRYLDGTKLIQTATKDSTKLTTKNDQYMFIAPQKLSSEEIVITYVVKTTDKNNQFNGSEITNTITKKWSEFRDAAIASNGLESGKQYNLYFLIGVQSVKIAATVTDWVDGTDHVVDVPTAY